jgi:hypothetical protein
MNKLFYTLLLIAFFSFPRVSFSINFTSFTINHVSCLNASDGNICWSVANGQGPYYISILNSSISQTFGCSQSLQAGTYTLTITDATGSSISSVAVVGTNVSTTKIIASDTAVCLGDSITLSPMFNSNGAISPAAYCLPFFASINGANIGNVTFGTINNNSSCGQIGGYGSIADKYSIYTNLSTTITKSTSVPFSVKVDTCYQQGAQGNTVAIYIDYNADGDFTDANEQAYIGTQQIGARIETGSIFTPNNLLKGIARMRVIVANTVPANILPCGVFVNGEAEDYTLFFEQTPTSIYWQSNIFSSSSNTFNITPNIDSVYYLTVDYSNGCVDSGKIDLKVNPQPISSIGTANIACSNASLVANVQNGTAPFTYKWIPGGASTSSITGLINGLYQLKVTDTLGCIDSTTYNVSLTPSLASFPTINNVLCFGQNSGSINWGVSGGTAPLTYVWSPNVSTSINANNLGSGSYSVTVTDVNGCTLTKTTTITQPAAALAVLVSVQNVTSFASNDGKAKAAATGGTPPYTYKWTPSGETTDSIDNKGVGTFTITVKDVNNCSVTDVISFTADNLDEIAKLYNLQISPNPASSSIVITAEKYLETIQMTDVLGKILFTEKANDKSKTIDINNYADGVYFIKINNLLTRKIVIRK